MVPHKQREKELFSMKNAEEKGNMPWPKLKKPWNMTTMA